MLVSFGRFHGQVQYRSLLAVATQHHCFQLVHDPCCLAPGRCGIWFEWHASKSSTHLRCDTTTSTRQTTAGKRQHTSETLERKVCCSVLRVVCITFSCGAALCYACCAHTFTRAHRQNDHGACTACSGVRSWCGVYFSSHGDAACREAEAVRVFVF